MPKKYIRVPEAVMPTNPHTGEVIPPGKPITFLEFTRSSLLNDPRWSSTYNALCSRASVDEAIRDAEAGVAVLAEEDWKILDDVVQNPQKSNQQPGYDGYHPSILPQFLPFLRAIRMADGNQSSKEEVLDIGKRKTK